MTNQITKPCHFTNSDGVVLILKQVELDGTAHGGFRWPTTIGATVEAPDWTPEAKCGGGLHGWPWGLAMGEGKDPDYKKLWIVFSAKPEDVVDIEGKCKAKKGVVVACGTYLECHLAILKGQIDWTQHAARGAASSTGYHGAASSTGDQGAASSTGYQGAASSTGYRGAASSTGYRCTASSTGYQGAASSTGYHGAASSTGDQGAASSTGDRGAASSTGYRGAASSTGGQGAASSTGDQGAASSTGYQGAASSTGDQGAASSTGDRGAASSTGDFGTVECGPTGICAVCSDTCFWKIQAGATLAMKSSKGSYLLLADDWQVKPGDTVCVEHGVIWTNYEFDGYTVT